MGQDHGLLPVPVALQYRSLAVMHGLNSALRFGIEFRIVELSRDGIQPR